MICGSLEKCYGEFNKVVRVFYVFFFSFVSYDIYITLQRETSPHCEQKASIRECKFHCNLRWFIFVNCISSLMHLFTESSINSFEISFDSSSFITRLCCFIAAQHSMIGQVFV